MRIFTRTANKADERLFCSSKNSTFFFLISNYRCNVLRRTVMCGGFIITMKHTCVCVNVLYLSVDVRRRRLKWAPIKNIRALVDRNISVTFPFVAQQHITINFYCAHTITHDVYTYMLICVRLNALGVRNFQRQENRFLFLNTYSTSQTNCVCNLYALYRNLRNSWWFFCIDGKFWIIQV